MPLGAALFNAGERDDGAGERERVRDDGLPSSGAIFGERCTNCSAAASLTCPYSEEEGTEAVGGRPCKLLTVHLLADGERRRC